MQLRTYALTCALLALLAAPREPAERAPAHARGPDVVRGCDEQPLPFLGSGGVVVQLPVTQPAPPLSLRRSSGCGRLPAFPHLAAWHGRHNAALPLGELAVSVRACRLGTPPPAPRSGRAACPAHPVQA